MGCEEFRGLNTFCLFSVSLASGNQTQNKGIITFSADESAKVETSGAQGAIPRSLYFISPNLLLKYQVPLTKY